MEGNGAYYMGYRLLSGIKNGFVLKFCLRKMSRIVRICIFWGNINGWDLKILYRDLESWKKRLKKIEWNGMICRIKKLNGLE